jgi:WD40 repeat protein
MGTPSHMAPEQWRDEPATPATDQYALGVMTYLLVTGRLPFFASTSHGFMYKHLNEEPVPPHMIRAVVPESVAPVLAKALAKQPENRYRIVADFAQAFAVAVQELVDMPTDFFTFSLSPVTVPIASITVEQMSALPQTVEHQFPMQLHEAPVLLQAPIAPMPEPVPDSTTPRLLETTPQPNYALLTLVGAIVGILLLVGVVGIAVIILSSITNRQNDTSPQGAAAETIPTSTSGVIPTLTPITTQRVLIPTPAITSIAQANSASPPDVSSSAMTSANVVEVKQIASLLIEAVPIRSLTFNPDGNIIASGNGDNTVRLWNVEPPTAQTILQGHSGVVYDVAFNMDGRLLASASGDQTIHLWDVQSGGLVHALQGHNGEVRSVAFSPDGSMLASAGEDRTVRRWDVASGAQQAILNGHSETVLTVAYNSDGTLLASGGRDGVILIWDMTTGSQRASLTGHEDEVRTVVFSPDGTTLASASADNTIRIWDINTGTELMTLRDHGRDVFSVAFSPDGSLLASGGRDNTVRLWNTHTGEEIGVLLGHDGWVFDVDFSPDGALIASAGGDGTLRLWGF